MKRIKNILIILLALAFHLFLTTPLFGGPDGETHSLFFMVMSGIDPDMGACARRLCLGAMDFVIIGVAMLLMHPAKEIFGELGLARRTCLRGLAIGFLLTLPMFITNAVCGKFTFTWETVFLSFWAGFYEEILFRGFLFGQLFRSGRLGFFTAILLPSLLFGMCHLYQANDLMSALLTVAVTALGSLLFGWLYVEWNYSLWVPMSLHAFMDLSWTLFPVGVGGYGATGNITVNIGRAITVILAVVITIMNKKKQGRKCFDYKKF